MLGRRIRFAELEGLQELDARRAPMLVLASASANRVSRRYGMMIKTRRPRLAGCLLRVWGIDH
jgi:hypothetical protein